MAGQESTFTFHAAVTIEVSGQFQRFLVVRKKYIRAVLNLSFMLQFCPAGIRDAAHQEWMSQRLGNLLEYSGAALAALPLVNSDRSCL